MAKKDVEKKKSIFDDLFCGMFDFNHDGKMNFGETYAAHYFLSELLGEDKPDKSSCKDSYDSDYTFSSASASVSKDNSWRLFCEDGSEYDIDSNDYETEEEYEEDLEEAKYAWRDDVDDGSDYDIYPEDYETEEEYEEALEEARTDGMKEC